MRNSTNLAQEFLNLCKISKIWERVKLRSKSGSLCRKTTVLLGGTTILDFFSTEHYHFASFLQRFRLHNSRQSSPCLVNVVNVRLFPNCCFAAMRRYRQNVFPPCFDDRRLAERQCNVSTAANIQAAQVPCGSLVGSLGSNPYVYIHTCPGNSLWVHSK